MKRNPKVIAFYLPQFHPIPENDEWWGKGFTEWTNASKATPLFDGHYQPHLPADLGFYDLRLPDARIRQAALAQEYGIYGFCYYYYWFSGKKLLEQPIYSMLETGTPDFPFCICWANENWTRTWDGQNKEVLIAQQYSKEDRRNLISNLAPFFCDKRYIRIDDKPVFLVYRPQMIPDILAVINEWRECAKEYGLQDLYLCAALTFGQNELGALGFDATVEFPPHTVSTTEVSPSSLGVAEGFSGKIYRYPEVVLNEISKKSYSFKTFRSAMTSWDNSPRTGLRGHIFIDANPTDFEIWLRHLVRQARENGNEFIFINAWNEWAEGAHLEPDCRYGCRWLEAVRNATTDRTTAEMALAILHAHWKDLPDCARDAITTLEDVIGANQRSFKVTAQLIRDKLSLSNVFMPIHLANELPENLRHLTFRADGVGFIENVNGLPASSIPSSVVMKSGQSLSLKGWLVSPGIEVNESSELVVFIQDVASNIALFAIQQMRLVREDVVSYFVDKYPETETRYSGFDLTLSLAGVQPGRYTISIGSAGATAVIYNEARISVEIEKKSQGKRRGRTRQKEGMAEAAQ